MPFYTLREGQQCGHNGRDLRPGEVIELPVTVGLEVAGKLVPCTKDGTVLSHLSPVDLEVEQGEAHERESIRASRRTAPKAAVVGDVPVAPAATVQVKVVPTSGASSGPDQ